MNLASAAACSRRASCSASSSCLLSTRMPELSIFTRMAPNGFQYCS